MDQYECNAAALIDLLSEGVSFPVKFYLDTFIMDDQRKYHSWSKSNMADVPFYAVPSHLKTSSEIINEARTTVKPIDTKRPFTPRANHRRLFGMTAWNSRPASAFALEHVFYDSNDARLASPARLAPLDSPAKKSKEQPNASLPIRPLSHLVSLPEESLVVRKISSAPSKIHLPTLESHRYDIQVSSREYSLDLHRRAMTLQEGDARSLRYALKHPLDPSRNINVDSVRHMAFISAAKTDFNLDAKISPLLNKMTGNTQEIQGCGDVDTQGITVVRQLYEVLRSEQLLGKMFKQRSAILRAIFRLLESKNVALVLEAVRLCLVMNVTGNNLLLVSKVIFKITRHDGNDLLFLENKLLELLLETVTSASPLRDTEALVYNIGSLKFLAMNPSLLSELSRLKCIDVLTCHMNRINEYKKASGRISEQATHVLFQLTGCLRNVAESSVNRHAFVKSGTIREMCQILELFSDDYDIIMNVVRIFSKLTMYYEVCNDVTENVSCFLAAVDLMERYRHKPELIVRLCFAFGNITAKSEEARIHTFQHPKCLDILLGLVQLYLESDNAVGLVDRRRDIKAFTPAVEPNSKGEDWSTVNDDVVVKTVRLLANLSVSVDVGHRIASNSSYCGLLINILATKNVERNEEMVLSAAGALSNLSYYLTETSSFPPLKPEQLVECLFRLLACEHLEALIECLRILGNISREEQIRQLLATKKVLETAIQLTESDNKDVIYLSCGLLMNFMVDEVNRTAMKCQNGDSRLIGVLRDFGPRDWQLATVICQTLWNYSCIDDATVVRPFQPDVAGELLCLLNIYLDEKKVLDSFCNLNGKTSREIAHDIWLLEFSPVATRLAQRIQWLN